MSKKKVKKKECRQQIVYEPINVLKENPFNARTHTKKQIQKIGRSIKEFEFNGAILIDENKTIIAGHGRYRAAKLLGMEEVPTITITHLSPEKIRALMIADNKIALAAGWNEKMLIIEFEYLLSLPYDFDVTLTGFEAAQIDFMLIDKEEKTDKADILPIESAVKPRVNSGEL